MRRISLFEIAGAVERTGFTLVTDITLSRGTRCGCPIGVLAFDEDEDESDEATQGVGFASLYRAAMQLSLLPDYAAGFAHGFDNEEPARGRGDAYRLGHNDGRGARILLDVA